MHFATKVTGDHEERGQMKNQINETYKEVYRRGGTKKMKRRNLILTVLYGINSRLQAAICFDGCKK